MMLRGFLLNAASFLPLCISASSFAQQPATGLPPLGSFAEGPFDAINLANLDDHFSLPILRRAGRGIPFSYNLSYDSLVWVPVNPNGAQVWTPVSSNWGWRQTTEASTGYVTYSDWRFTPSCNYGITTYTYWGFAYHDPNGGIHPFPGTVTSTTISNSSCGTLGTTITSISNALTTDNSGYIVTTSTITALGQATVNAPGGIKITTPNVGSSVGPGSVTDANGNTINIAYNASSGTTITDTLGDTLTISLLQTDPQNPNAKEVVYSYLPPGGGQAVPVTVYYYPLMVQTCFQAQVPGVQDFAPSPEYMPYYITYPDGSSYLLSFEDTVGCNAESGTITGRIASIMLATGGTITYAYGTTNTMMADGSPSTLTRTLSGPDVTTGTWTYYRTPQSGGLPQASVTFYDPSGNETDLNFSGIYETERYTYQGSGGSKVVLNERHSCYNGNETNCPTATITAGVPITYKDLYDALDQSGPYARYQFYYDQYGNQTQEIDHDYTSGNPVIRQVVTNYNSSLCSIPTNICDHPANVEIEDGSGAEKAYSAYSYNGNGNLTNLSQWVSGSAAALVTQYNYNSNGTLNYAIDPNGTRTSYTYGSGSCNSAFPTSVTVGGLTTQYAYNCNGGVVTSVTDANQAVTSTAYTDPYFWRPASTTDALNNVTNYYYDTPNEFESVMSYNNGNSATDKLVLLDGLGRPILNQTRQAPGSENFDTAQVVYDATGRISQTAQPFTSTAWTGETVGHYYTTTDYAYDTLGRYTSVSGSDGSNTNYFYRSNDTLIESGPAPGNENIKSRQLQLDALGRISSVCSLLPSGGGSSCGQNYNPGTNGYVTTYTYDPLGDLTGVSQAAGTNPYVETRSFAYDGLGRMTSESNPESGTVSYTYDSIGANYCAAGGVYNSPGDLVAKADQAGNHLCYYYDSLHRLTAMGNNHQSAANPCRRFSYDNSTGYEGTIPPGITINDPMGRIVEAATDNCGGQGDPLLTDEWFSYDARGESTDFYESTPHSGGYYHTTANYWANGLLHDLGSYSSGVRWQTYTPDGEGRVYTVNADNGQNPVTSTAYNPAGLVTSINFGSGDSDAFTYNPSSGRTTQVAYNVGAQQVVSNLVWNADGSLGSLSITDPLNPANQQNCTPGSTPAFVRDDLGRLTTVNCGSTWHQSFTYDAFGNITKSGSSSWNPSYIQAGNQVNNQYVQGGSISYDANGNLLSDTFNTYTWDVYGDPVTVNSQSLVFDALGRMVENSTSSREYVFAPGSSQLYTLMNGQTLVQTQYQLPSGGVAIYNGGTLTYMHPDWLGSGRLVTSSTQTMVADSAYAPFGEQYAATGSSYDFTGQQQWTTTGLDDFLFRRYHPVQGRWISPDPAGTAAVDITNPQTWNRYAYVSNNPLNAIDPWGLYRCIVDGVETNCPGLVPQGGAGGGGGIPVYTTGTCQSDLPGTDGGAVYYSCTVLTGYASGNGAGGGGSYASNCRKPNPAQGAVIKGLTYVANWTNKTIGVGVGASYGLGFGQGFGFAGTLSVQIQVSPGGRASLVYTVGGSGLTQDWLTPSSFGASFVFGPQVSVSNAPPSPGPGVDVAVSGVLSTEGLGPGGSIDINGTADGVTGTFTGGIGAGLLSGSAVKTQTVAVPFCVGG